MNNSNCNSDTDPQQLWHTMQQQAQQLAVSEPLLTPLLRNSILDHDNLSQGLCAHLSQRLATSQISAEQLRSTLEQPFSDASVTRQAARDIEASCERDSACSQQITPFLYYKGFLALQSYRAAHYLWRQQQQASALLLQHLASIKFAVDIHPAAIIGSGVMIDHATGVVIGETAVVGDCVSIMQSVTLGGTGKEGGDRHPKVRCGVLLGPGAKVLGNIEIGEGAMVAAASVVLKAVPDHAIVAGVPATVVGHTKVDEPSKLMDHYFKVP